MVRRYISVVSIRSLTPPFCLIDHGPGRLTSMASVMWFRRDLRLADNPALAAAAAEGPVLPLFVLDPTLWESAGPSRRAHLAASLRALDAPLSVLEGDPVERVVQAAREVGAERVHVAAAFGPNGVRRDAAVQQALAAHGIGLVRTG